MGNMINYLLSYQNQSLKDLPFNEVDASIFSELAYFPFDVLDSNKKIIDSKTLLDLIKDFKPLNNAKRRSLDLNLLQLVLRSERFKNIKVAYYEKDKSIEKEKQFLAVTFLHKDFIYVSFGGTDASLTGWKEDLNLSYQKEIFSDISASLYLKKVLRRFPLSNNIYIGGHSKGGRLAVFALKSLDNVKRIKKVFSFDGPGFDKSFYDDKYQNISHLICKICPEESIIGRLLHEDENVLIVKSNERLLMQHDNYSWEVSGSHFVFLGDYSKGSTHVVNVINSTVENMSFEDKRYIVDAIYDLLLDLDIKELKDANYNKLLVMNALKNFRGVWKNLDEDKRKSLTGFLLKIITTIIKEYSPLPKKNG